MNEPEFLICYDGSDAAAEAIERTALLHPGAEVSILSVWQPLAAFVLSWGLMAADLATMDTESRVAAERIAEQGAGLARAAGLRPHAHVTQGPFSVARAILDWCDKHHPKLLVVGATGRSGIGDFLMGSVANAMIHRASVPVLVVPCPRDRSHLEQHSSRALASAGM